MATYKEIQGTAVQSLASNAGTIEGQIWYDNANQAFKLESVTGSATWASGGALPGGRQSAGFAGIQTAGLLAGGANPSTYTSSNSFSYDGSSWTATNSLGTARRNTTMMGIQGAALLASSSNTSPPNTATVATEEFDGTNWSAGGNMNTARYGSYAGGTLTQGVVAGGSGPPGYKDDTEEYNGSSWTSVTNMPGDQGNGCSGSTSQLDMLCVGGGPGNKTSNTIYDGTNWTTGNTLSGDGRRGNRGALTSTSAPGFTAGGETATTNPINVTEEWNGTSFSSSTNMPASTRDSAGQVGGTGAAGLIAGGFQSTISQNVYEFTGSGISETQTITTS